jgi:hypothetical protein
VHRESLGDVDEVLHIEREIRIRSPKLDHVMSPRQRSNHDVLSGVNGWKVCAGGEIEAIDRLQIIVVRDREGEDG